MNLNGKGQDLNLDLRWHLSCFPLAMVVSPSSLKEERKRKLFKICAFRLNVYCLQEIINRDNIKFEIIKSLAKCNAKLYDFKDRISQKVKEK